MNKINARLKELRIKNNLSIEELSEKTGISILDLTSYEDGTNLIFIKHFEILADFYKIDDEIVHLLTSDSTEVLKGESLPQLLRDAGVTAISVNRGYKISEETAKSLLEFINSQKM